MGLEAALATPIIGSLTAGSALGAVGTGLSLFSGLSSIMGGYEAQAEAGYQSQLAIQQAEAAAAESERLAFKEAKAEQEASDEARRRQKVAYLASGVSLAGTPLLVMEETRQKGIENVNEILQGGQASKSATLTEGRLQAKQLKSTGRKAFSQGITSGIRSIAGAF